MPKWDRWLDDENDKYEPSFEKFKHKKHEYDDEKVSRLKKLNKPKRIPKEEQE